MIITPKNWQDFQHYKDRSPAWIKLHKSLLTNYEFICLPIASKALAPMLWLLASEYKDGIIEASLDKISFRLSMTRGDFSDAISPLVQAGFFETSESLASCQHESIPRREQVKEENIDKRREDSPRIRAVRETSPDFEEFWKSYPRREGPNPRKPAEQKFTSLVKTGIDPGMLISEVRKFGDAEGSRGNIGTRFIPQAVTWLNQQRWTDHAAIAAVQYLNTGGQNGKAGSVIDAAKRQLAQFENRDDPTMPTATVLSISDGSVR